MSATKTSAKEPARKNARTTAVSAEAAKPAARGTPPPARTGRSAARVAKRRKPVFAGQSHPLLGGGLLLAALLLLVALACYDYKQVFWLHDSLLSNLARTTALDPSDFNPMGRLGATVAALLFNLAGLAAFFLPFALTVAAVLTFMKRTATLWPWRVAHMSGAFVALASLLTRLDSGRDPASVVSVLGLANYIPKSGVGGALGELLCRDFAGDILGELGALLLFLGLYVFCLTGIFVESPTRHIAAFALRVARLVRDWRLNHRRRTEARRKARAKALAERRARLAATAKGGTAAAPAAATATGDTAGATGNDEDDSEGNAGAGDAPPVDNPLDHDPSDFGFLGTHPTEPPTLYVPPEPVPEDNSGDDPDALADDAENEAGAGADATGGVSSAAPTSVVEDSRVTDALAAPIGGNADAGSTSGNTLDAAGNDAPRVADAGGGLRIFGPETEERADPSAIQRQRGDYKVPPVELLNAPPPVDESAPKEDFQARAELIVSTLKDFDINTSVAAIQAGPVITRYEIYPPKGVKVEKISALERNIMLELKSKSIRIQAPVPGKNTVGIEVPNAKAANVLMRDILESKAWAERSGEIPIVLGKEVTGRIIISDLAKMPHLLIAGSTGSGKSVCINCILTSLIYHAGPEDVRLILVDPKVVEMKIYEKIPHLLIPVLTDMRKVQGALEWLINEMERRYALFARWGVRNIAYMNAKITKDRAAAKLARQMELELTPAERAALAPDVAKMSVPRDEGVIEDELPKTKLPYIVCIVDEFADLMMQASTEVETSVNRLAAKARAAGIHLILATQRPEVKVITGAIKANLPSRIAFKVISPVDSVTILSSKGAEALIGKGDMLFIPPGTAEHQRVQGAFLADEEIERIVEAVVESNGEAEFDDTVSDAIEQFAAKNSDDDDMTPTEGTDDPNQDPYFKKAVELFRSEDKASTSLMQRRLGLGYGRAARILDEIAKAGYIVKESNKPNAPWKVVRQFS